MKTSISIGSYINSQLNKNSELKRLAGDKIYPIVAEDNTSFPYIVFTKGLEQVKVTKTCHGYDEIVVTVTAVAKNYFEVCNIMEIVRSILENNENQYILQSYVSAMSEGFVDGAFVHSITFNMLVSSIYE